MTKIGMTRTRRTTSIILGFRKPRHSRVTPVSDQKAAFAQWAGEPQ